MPVPAVLRRSIGMRLAAPGAPTRRAEAAGAAHVARALAARLPPDATELWVAQSFLPYLWRDGHLGGRRFSVFMARPPMHWLHAQLDDAAAAHPDRGTLADHRADPALVAAEADALARADAVITPHAGIAALFPGRAVHLPWRLPSALPLGPRQPRRIAFPGPTLARKGAHEVRAAARLLDLEVVLIGAELEGPGFWDGVRTPPARPVLVAGRGRRRDPARLGRAAAAPPACRPCRRRAGARHPCLRPG